MECACIEKRKGSQRWGFFSFTFFILTIEEIINGHSIIDPTVSLLCKDIEQLERLNPGSDHETRINLMNLYKEKQFLPNHIKCIFGKVDDLYVYVGAPGTAEEGIKRNVLLRKEYPDNPCFQDVYNGTTAMQRMIMD